MTEQKSKTRELTKKRSGTMATGAGLSLVLATGLAMGAASPPAFAQTGTAVARPALSVDAAAEVSAAIYHMAAVVDALKKENAADIRQAGRCGRA